MKIRRLDVNKDYKELSILDGKGVARAIIYPGMGAKYASLNYFVMKPGSKNTAHVHARSEDVIYVIQGQGIIKETETGNELRFKKGDILFIPEGVYHQVIPDGDEDYIGIGGPQPVDDSIFKDLS